MYHLNNKLAWPGDPFLMYNFIGHAVIYIPVIFTFPKCQGNVNPGVLERNSCRAALLVLAAFALGTWFPSIFSRKVEKRKCLLFYWGHLVFATPAWCRMDGKLVTPVISKSQHRVTPMTLLTSSRVLF